MGIVLKIRVADEERFEKNLPRFDTFLIPKIVVILEL
jgi:hypothetical protein